MKKKYLLVKNYLVDSGESIYSVHQAESGSIYLKTSVGIIRIADHDRQVIHHNRPVHVDIRHSDSIDIIEAKINKGGL